MEPVLPKIPLNILRQVPQEVWDTSTPGRSVTATPVVIHLLLLLLLLLLLNRFSHVQLCATP